MDAGRSDRLARACDPGVGHVRVAPLRTAPRRTLPGKLQLQFSAAQCKTPGLRQRGGTQPGTALQAAARDGCAGNDGVVYYRAARSAVGVSTRLPAATLG